MNHERVLLSLPLMSDGNEELEVEVDDGGDEAEQGAASGGRATPDPRMRGLAGAWPPVAAGAPELTKRQAGVRARGARRDVHAGAARGPGARALALLPVRDILPIPCAGATSAGPGAV